MAPMLRDAEGRAHTAVTGPAADEGAARPALPGAPGADRTGLCAGGKPGPVVIRGPRTVAPYADDE
ncbi:hypothetical protein [Streptomyces sioyaensis]|uniref:hypothetical protein n=1 Tax=Streptomyces sioyaensis TaxID=67364 RepID=UPI0037AB1625